MNFRLPILLLASATLLHAQEPYAGFEARLTHPIELTPDGSKLLAVHAEAASLAVFDVSGPVAAPTVVQRIPVGLEPVSVRARDNAEAWVVNEVSDSIHIVSLTAGQVTAILPTGDEPADVVFANGKAFVTCARQNELWIFDAVTRSLLVQVPLQGLYPSSLAVNQDGSRVFAAFLHSGNGTTILPRDVSRTQPAPTNPSLPASPYVATIVPDTHPEILYTVVNHDVVEINTATHAIERYIGSVGTNLFAMAQRPGLNELWVSNTEALNLIQFEPQLNGRFNRNRLSVVDLTTANVAVHDLNPAVDYNVLPNPAAQATALAQPYDIVFTADGTSLWTAAFASDRVARIDAATGAVSHRVDVRTGGGDSEVMRGPRGLALHPVSGRLYVLNKLSQTVSVIDSLAATPEVVVEVELSNHDPMPEQVREGRGFLFDARLSGNGMTSCGICHLDADRDGLAWDLGDPGAELQTVLGANLSIHDTTLRPRVMHPMKGPMTTQTLRGMQNHAPFHWRGDRATIADFNPTYHKLMGGEEIEDEQMAALTAYLETLRHHSNPNRNLDRSLPTSFPTATGNGNPQTGRDLYNNHSKSHCAVCHTLPSGSDNNIDLPQEVGLEPPIGAPAGSISLPMKTPPMRTVYQRMFYNPAAGATSLSGYGILHDGTGFSLPIGHPYVLDQLNTAQELRDVAAFVMCFDTGTSRAVGHGVLVTESNRAEATVLNAIALLETRARVIITDNFEDSDLVVRGTWQGHPRKWFYNIHTQLYRADHATGGHLTRAALLDGLQAGDSLTFLGVLQGQGNKMGGDYDGDGVLDGDDANHRQYNGDAPLITEDPADLAVAPGHAFTLTVTSLGELLEYQWYKNNQPIHLANGPEYHRAAATLADEGSYHVVITNPLGEATSEAARVEVYPAPTITVQPVSRVIDQNKNTSLSVTAAGEGLKYQWRRGMQNVNGATGRVLSFPNAKSADAGSYQVVVSNGAGSVNSDVVTLTVIIPPLMQSLDLTDATMGQPYDFLLTALNGPTRFTVRGLPKGLALTNNNRITGKPTQSGDFTVRIIAHNSSGSSLPLLTTLTVKPFPTDAVGVFEGVAPRHDGLNQNLGGTLRLTSSKQATFSGSLRLGSKVYPFRSSWQIINDGPPESAFEIKRKKQSSLAITATVDPDLKQGQITITDTGNSQSIAFDVWRAQTGATADAGNYSFALPAPAHSDDTPHGDGFGGFKLSTKGAARGSMRLGDGTALTLSASLLEGGRMRVWNSLYRGTGSLSGLLRVRASETHRMEGSQLGWMKKTQTRKTRSYMGGFDELTLEARGGLHLQLPKNSPIPGFVSTELVFADGGAPDPVTRMNVAELVFPPKHPAKASIMGVNPALVSVTLQTGAGKPFAAGSTGTYIGKFTLGDTDTTVPSLPLRKRVVTFRGRVVDDGSGPRGYGHFLLPEMPTSGPPVTTLKSSRVLSGSASLLPLPTPP